MTVEYDKAIEKIRDLEDKIKEFENTNNPAQLNTRRIIRARVTSNLELLKFVIISYLRNFPFSLNTRATEL